MANAILNFHFDYLNTSLNTKQEKKIKKILNKDKDFYVKLISSKNKKPITYFRQRLKSEPQIGNGILSLVGTLAPLIASLFSRR